MIKLQQLFMPEGQKFYKLFNEVAANLKQISIEFHAAIINSEDRFNDSFSRLDALEKANDDVTHRLFVELGRNFITPFDREDIHFLISALDDIADLSYGVVRQMNSYGINSAGNTTQYVSVELKRYTEQLVTVINGLNNKRTLGLLGGACYEMKKIITACDSRIDMAVAGLFPTEKDPVMIIKWMEHYELLGVLLEKCENAINILEAIIIKYS